MKFGLHVSAAGGAFNAPLNAAQKNCETFQFFSRSPQGGKAPELTPDIVQQFKQHCKDNGFERSYIHTPYYINFASANDRIRNGSIEIVRGELERASLLGVTAVMTHLGSAKDVGVEKAHELVVAGLGKILNGYTGSARFLIELAAGSGDILGARFEEVAGYISEIEKANKKLKGKIGVCLDTCHVFAVGYDLRTSKAVTETFKKLDDIIGLERLVVIHCNDSKFELGARRDRHEHLGDGKIGAAGFKALVQHPKLKNVDLICETPHDGKELVDLKRLTSFRKK